jgi:hypothetical protein
MSLTPAFPVAASSENRCREMINMLSEADQTELTLAAPQKTLCPLIDTFDGGRSDGTEEIAK